MKTAQSPRAEVQSPKNSKRKKVGQENPLAGLSVSGFLQLQIEIARKKRMSLNPLAPRCSGASPRGAILLQWRKKDG